MADLLKIKDGRIAEGKNSEVKPFLFKVFRNFKNKRQFVKEEMGSRLRLQ